MTHKFLSKFQTLADYNNFLVSAQCPYTNVSYVEQTDLNYYFKDNTYTSQPFTIIIDKLPDGVEWCALRSDYFYNRVEGKFLKFRVNDGPWMNLTFEGEWIDSGMSESIHFVEGDTIQFIGNMMSYDLIMPTLNFCTHGEWDALGGGYEFTVEGNVMSLYSENYMGIQTVPSLLDDRSPIQFQINSGQAKTIDLSGAFIPARPTGTMTYFRAFYGNLVDSQYNGSVILPTIYSYGYNTTTSYPSLSEVCSENGRFSTVDIYIDGAIPSLVNALMAGGDNPDSKLTQVNITYGDNLTAVKDIEAYSMFYNRNALATLPNLNPIFNTMASKGKNINAQSMFQECHALVDASELEIRNVITNNMFYNCYSLEKSPKIYMSWIGENMFNGCSSLDTIYYLYSGDEEGMVGPGAYENIPATGTFYVSSNPPSNIDSLVPSGWSKVTYTE